MGIGRVEIGLALVGFEHQRQTGKESARTGCEARHAFGRGERSRQRRLGRELIYCFRGGRKRTGTQPQNYASGHQQGQSGGQKTKSYDRCSQSTAILVHRFPPMPRFAQVFHWPESFMSQTVSLRSFLVRSFFVQISGEIGDGARTFCLAPVNFAGRSCSRLTGSLELAEKLNNYLNIRRIDKSSDRGTWGSVSVPQAMPIGARSLRLRRRQDLRSSEKRPW